MAMRNTLSDRDFFVASGRAEHDSKVFDRTMSDDMTIKSPKQVLTAKTAPTTVRSSGRRSDEELRWSFR
jgi:ketosteroid isomerase-like protein